MSHDPEFPYEFRTSGYARSARDLPSAVQAAKSIISAVVANPIDKDGNEIGLTPDHCLDYEITIYGPESPRWGIVSIRWDVLRAQFRTKDLIRARTFLTEDLIPTDPKDPVAMRADVRNTIRPGCVFPLTDIRDFYRRAGYSLVRARAAAKADVQEFVAQGLMCEIQRGWFSVP